MNVSCPECGSIFRVDPAKVPEGGVRARCSICGGIIALSRETSDAGSRADASSSAREPESVPAGVAAMPSRASEPADRAAPVGDRYAPSAMEPEPAAAPSAPAREEAPFAAQPTPSGGRRPINPFLNNDPGMKAKRLARALVSDMITYQPQKREEGLKNNTLKQLFREEIKKSYEEYVEQVGRDVAESTGHFQEALNDILANGRKVF